MKDARAITQIKFINKSTNKETIDEANRFLEEINIRLKHIEYLVLSQNNLAVIVEYLC